jgi:hypothetical protein
MAFGAVSALLTAAALMAGRAVTAQRAGEAERALLAWRRQPQIAFLMRRPKML